MNRTQMQGAAKVGEYLHRYAAARHWHLANGFVEGHPAVIVIDPSDVARLPRYFVLLDWRDGKVAQIRDFLFASYVMESAEVAFAKQ